MSFKSHVELSNLQPVQEITANEALTCSPPAAMVVAENTLCHVCLLLLMHFSVNHWVPYNMTQLRYTTEQHMCIV
jgi:hypothetical protein